MMTCANFLRHLLGELAYAICKCCLQGLTDTTKARDGQQRVPLMAGIGNAIFVNDITHAEIRSAACVLLAIAQQADQVHSNVVPVRAATPALQLVA